MMISTNNVKNGTPLGVLLIWIFSIVLPGSYSVAATEEVTAEVEGYAGTVNGGLDSDGSFLLNPMSQLQSAVKVEWMLSGNKISRGDARAACSKEPADGSLYLGGVVRIHLPDSPLRKMQMTGVAVATDQIRPLGDQKLTSEGLQLALLDTAKPETALLPSARIFDPALLSASIKNDAFNKGEATVLDIQKSPTVFCGLAEGKWDLAMVQKMRLLPFTPVDVNWLTKFQAAVIGSELQSVAENDIWVQKYPILQMMAAAKAYATNAGRSLLEIPHSEILPFARLSSKIMSHLDQVSQEDVSDRLWESSRVDGEFFAEGEIQLNLKLIEMVTEGDAK